jgi:hypothetical protein
MADYQLINTLEYQTRLLGCIKESVSTLSGGDVVAPIGGTIVGTIQNAVATLTTGDLTGASSDIRSINVQLESSTLVEVLVTFTDNSTTTHNMFGGSYTLELDNNQTAVKSVTLTEIDGTSTRAIINYISK